MLSTASMLPLGATVSWPWAAPIVALWSMSVVRFDAAGGAAGHWALLMAYGIGMPAYLGRDVLVRVFYALGDANNALPSFRWRALV